MRIVLDLQAVQAPPNRSRGIGRAYRSLVREIILQRGEHDVIVVISGLLYDYAEEIWEQLSDILPIDNFRVWHGIAQISWHQSRQTDVWAYERQVNVTLYEAFLASLAPDVVLFGNFCDGFHDGCLLPGPESPFKIPRVMVCHDLIPLVYPRLYDDRSGSGFIDFYRAKLVDLRNADNIFAFSNSVKDDVVRYLDVPADNVSMVSLGFTHLGGVPLSATLVQNVCQKYNIQKPFLLYVSAQDPRKNHVGVIEAFGRLDAATRDTYQILFAGSNFGDEGRLYEALKASNLPMNSLSIAIHPSDEDLQTIYKLAHLGIFASLYEGFGLGILESMAYGLPVIASNTSAMPEVMGRDDALFDPTDIDSMAQKIAQGLTDEQFRADLRNYGLAHVSRWDWAGCGQRAIAAFERIDAAGSGLRPSSGDFSARQWAVDALRALPMPAMTAVEKENAAAKMAAAIELTYPAPVGPRRRTLFVDISEFVHYDYNTGIQRVIKSIVIEMARQLTEVDLELVYSHADGIGYHYAFNLKDHLLNGKPRLPFDQESTDRVTFANGDVLFHSELTMPQVVKQRFYLQDLRRSGVRTMFLVYDLIPIKYSFHEGHHGKRAMLSWLSCLLQSDKVISISRATQADIYECVAKYDLTAQSELEVSWFHLGGDFQKYVGRLTRKLDRPVSAVLEQFRGRQIEDLKGKVNLLMVGTIEPRKGHVDMIRAMEPLWSRGVDANLVIVGKVGWLSENDLATLQQHPESGQHLFLFSDLSDAQLDEIYRLATGLLYFSKVEGFGLPLIEAAQYGLPIMVRDAPIFREVCGDHAFYFPDGLSPGEIAPYIERWLTLLERGEQPASTALPWLTWEDSVRILIAEIFARPDPAKRMFADSPVHRVATSSHVGEAVV